MRTIWNVVSVMAVANLLALAGYFGWLAGSGRLDRERMERLREILAEPVAAEKARLDDEARQRDAAVEAEREARKSETIPVRASDRLELKLELSEIDRQRILASRREVDDLKRGLVREREILDAEREGFRAEVEAFEATRARLAEIEGSAQFKKSVATLNDLAPKAAVAILMELLGPGAPTTLDADGVQRVTAYLNAVKPDVRVGIFAELAKGDAKLAAELLERLRTRGLLAEVGR